jgi:hypothetical protein
VGPPEGEWTYYWDEIPVSKEEYEEGRALHQQKLKRGEA